jgi:hypothetical protein
MQDWAFVRAVGRQLSRLSVLAFLLFAGSLSLFAASAFAAAPVNTAAPTISGHTWSRETLSADPGSWSGDTSGGFTYQWQSCDSTGQNCHAISGATSPTYTLQDSEINARIVVAVTAEDGSGNPTTAVSAATAAVVPPAPYGGSCHLVPNYGDGALTIFSVNCWGWSDDNLSDPLQYEFQWWSCDVYGANCIIQFTGPLTTTPFGEARMSAYGDGSGDGAINRVTVVLHESHGQTTTVDVGPAYLSGSYYPQWDPANPPTVSGNPWVGETLHATSGTWDNGPNTFSYQWMDCYPWSANWDNQPELDAVCMPITGATSQTYTANASDLGFVLAVEVAADNGSGFAIATDTARTNIVTEPNPVNTSLPTVSGTAKFGQTLTASNGSWAADTSGGFTYQWLRCDSSGQNCSAISGATGSTYVPAQADVGKTIVVAVTAHDSSADATVADSAPTAAITYPPPVNTALPAIVDVFNIFGGNPSSGDTLSANSGSWSGDASGGFSYQWEDCDTTGLNCQPISGATSSQYLTQIGDVGSTIAVDVTASGSGGSTVAQSAATALVALGIPQATANPSISGSVAVGNTVSANNGSWTNAPTSYSYEWDLCVDAAASSCQPISGATSSSYTIQPSDADQYLLVYVAAANGSGAGPGNGELATLVTPDVSITSGPADGSTTNTGHAAFGFSSSVAGTSFKCSLDGAAFAACTSPASYSVTPLSDGSHNFQVEAVTVAGNIGTPLGRTWTVDTTAPDVSITSGPADGSASDSAAAGFGFASTDPTASFLCSLDGAALSACSSPQPYSSLADGSHTFQVEAVDPAGNTSSPASLNWTVDTTAPGVTITSGPTAGSPSDSSSASLGFSSTDGTATFKCSLDGGPFAICSSTKSYSSLSDGSHTFQVEAIDPVGNTSSPASRTWTVDTTTPDVSITSGPADGSASDSAAAGFGFSSTDPTATFACSLDGGGFASCSTPQSYSGLSDGSHTFEVEALDTAGNSSTPLGHAWTIDTTAPDVSITSGPADGSVSDFRAAAFGFSSTDSTAVFKCTLDGSALSACTSPQSYSSLRAGAHVFTVIAVDPVGNQSAVTRRSWNVDLTAPAVTILTTPPSTTGQTSANFTFQAPEAASFSCSIDNGASRNCSSPAGYADLLVGTHTFRVSATDAAGNEGQAATYAWTIGTTPATPPTVRIVWGPSGTIVRRHVTIFFSSETASAFSCSLDGATFKPCTNPARLHRLSVGHHRFSVRATDAAGVNSKTVSAVWTVRKRHHKK